MELILASQSPRRRELLARMGLRNFRVWAPDVDETMPPGTPPQALVEALHSDTIRDFINEEFDGAVVPAF